MDERDLPFELAKLAEDQTINRDNTVSRWKRAEFYLGKYGPFVERFTPEEFSDQALKDRADTLRRHIIGAHR